MKTMVGIFETHKDAEYAIKKIHKRGFPLSHLSMMDDSVPVRRDPDRDQLRYSLGLLVGVIVGSLVGLLEGTGLINIPGLGFIHYAGALVGMLAGLSVGIFLGGIASIIIAMNQDSEERSIRNAPHKTMLIVDGDKKEVEEIEHILHEHETAA